MNIEDIRVRRITYKEKTSFLWMKRTKTINNYSHLEVKYNGKWVGINMVKEDKFI